MTESFVARKQWIRASCVFMVLVCAIGWSGVVQAQDGTLSLKVLTDIKSATVFLKIEARNESGRGTGFIVHAEGQNTYVVTNYHVIDPDMGRRPISVSPAILAVFHSGTKKEQSLRGELVAADPYHDLAVVKVQGVQTPSMLTLGEDVKLVETMPIFVLGFPLGELLATNKGNPAITVGKGTVSSIRTNDQGQLTTIQVDGDFTPGNSGGPVVDSQGRLVGIATATVKTRRIGFAVPVAKLARLLQGQVVDYRVSSRNAGADQREVEVHLGVFDPLNRLRGITFYFLPGDKAQTGGTKLSTLPGSKKAGLARSPLEASAKFTLAMAEPAVTFQAVYVNGQGKTFVTNPKVGKLSALPVIPDPFKPPVVINPGPPGRELDKATLARALDDLKSNDNNRCRGAADRLSRALPGEGSKEIVQALVPLLENKDLFVRTSCARAYVIWAGKEGSGTLYNILKTSTCFITRSIAIEGLGKGEGIKAAQAIAGTLPDLATRAPAAKTLIAMGSPAEPFVLPFLTHKDFTLRSEVCRILKEIGTAKSLEALKTASADPLTGKAAQEASRAISARTGAPKN